MVHPPIPERTDLFQAAAALNAIGAGLTRGLSMLDRQIPRVSMTLEMQVTSAAGPDLAKLHLLDELGHRLGMAHVETHDKGLHVYERTEGPLVVRLYTTTRSDREVELESEIARLKAELAATRQGVSS